MCKYHCVCARVVISWQVFFLNPTSAASVEDYHHHMTSCIFPAVSELTCKDLTLVFSSFFPLSLLWLSVCYTSGGQWWEKCIPETQHGLSCSIYKLLWWLWALRRHSVSEHTLIFCSSCKFFVCYLLNIGLGKLLRTMSFLLRNADAAGTHSVCRNAIRLCL